ncbi:Spy/CpxP family protein refolding chaperone [Parathalassolituus penaei]|uniref:Spy/CpxP family protein refolding chaperone n=1 Tax=Parathalassolituus penaei TaxID=2997323 RepID=A0A9X3EFN4_9GAMM|nr:Spy/CpxP family protein refolding chaperone [Parathalassolituus penaei]MCY0965875.1 Spy/CpxP family protein refolding chaperone [Parathalassolituus penaei]
MSNEFFSSRKILMGGVLAAVLGTASLVVIAKDATTETLADDQQRSCEDRGHDGDRFDRRDGQRGERDGRHGREMAGGMGRGEMGPGMQGGMHGGMGRGEMGPGMQGGMHGGMGRGGMGPDMFGSERAFGKLELTAEQRTAMTSVQDEARSKNWELMGEVMKVNNRIRDLYAADKFDEKALNQAYSNLASLQQKMFVSGSEARTHMLSLLTDEQRQQLKADDHGKGEKRTQQDDRGPRG